MSMGHFVRSAFWIGVYFIVVMTPLLVMLVGPTPPGRGFWRELSVGLGFAGLSMMGLQFFLTGRFRSITFPYGIDVVYHFHRSISLIAFLFILLHPVMIFAASPDALVLMIPAVMPRRTAAGLLGLLAFGIVIGTSLYRMKLGLRYEAWRALHGYASVAAVTLSVVHIVGVSYYVQGNLKRGVWIAVVIAWVLALVYVRLIKQAKMLKAPYRIERVIKERGRSWTLVLSPEGHEGMRFRPGQFAWLTAGRSPFSIREHPFSFSSSAMDTRTITMTVKELGDFTGKIGEIPPGTRAYIDGPYGTFTIDTRNAPSYVFIAGGVGITPVMSILRTMADRRDTRPVVLIYGNKTWEEVTFREDLEELKQRLAMRVVHVLDSPHEGWEGERGRVTAGLIARYLPENRMECAYFICGPEPMQRGVRAALDALGLPLEQVESESFNFV